MRYLLIISFLLSLTFSLNAQCSKIHFINTSLSFAEQKARKESKYIFVFVYELGESKAEFFESAIFYKRDICRKFNENFINVKARSTSSLGRNLIRQHRFDTLPAFLILDKNGRLVAKSDDLKGTNDLLRFADKAR